MALSYYRLAETLCRHRSSPYGSVRPERIRHRSRMAGTASSVLTPDSSARIDIRPSSAALGGGVPLQRAAGVRARSTRWALPKNDGPGRLYDMVITWSLIADSRLSAVIRQSSGADVSGCCGYRPKRSRSHTGLGPPLVGFLRGRGTRSCPCPPGPSFRRDGVSRSPA